MGSCAAVRTDRQQDGSVNGRPKPIQSLQICKPAQNSQPKLPTLQWYLLKIRVQLWNLWPFAIVGKPVTGNASPQESCLLGLLVAELWIRTHFWRIAIFGQGLTCSRADLRTSSFGSEWSRLARPICGARIRPVRKLRPSKKWVAISWVGRV